MKTLYKKIWDGHVVRQERGEPALIYIDLHLIHEVTTPQAFEGLRMNRRRVRRPELTVGTIDHAIPTIDRDKPFNDPTAAKQVETLRKNAADFGIRLYDLDSIEQGIIHVFGPEQGLTQPGMTIVCGDSHTSTHGAFGALAFGIGTSEVEHVLATQCLYQRESDNYRITFGGAPQAHVEPKDLILWLIRRIGAAGGNGCVFEFGGEAIENMSMAGRMTVCNMSIEAGARAGLVAPDRTTVEHLRGRTDSPSGEDWERAEERWLALGSDPDAVFEHSLEIDSSQIAPMVTWGTSPALSSNITEDLPELPEDKTERGQYESAYRYMDLEPGRRVESIEIDRVFIGSCTNARIEDLRAAARIVRGYKVANGVRGLVVPGSMRIKKRAEEEGIARDFMDAGFEWRDAGCSMCLGMNEDILAPGERCASTSNRNFEGRQGRGGRTHLVSPPMAAAAAVAGHFVDVREWKLNG